LIEGFENYDIAHAPLRAADATPPDVQLVLDLRRFEVATDGELTAVVALSARLLDKDGKVKASRLFEQHQKLEQLEPVAAVAAFNGAFGRLSKELIGWTATAM
jgi:phospholipid/cholesterol/gamma-HCH transport system substrate-binding protein